MNEFQQARFEKQLLTIAKGLSYPRTPDIAGAITRHSQISTRPRFLPRRLAWVLTFILILCSSLILIPPARAAIVEFIQIGVVRIFRAEPTPLAPPDQELPSTISPVTPTVRATPSSLLPMVENLAGEVNLERAQQILQFPLLLPTYPPDLGQPDRIFVQEAEGDMAILVWMYPEEPERVLLSLHFIQEGSWAIGKANPTVIQETAVNDQRAIWAVGPYPIKFKNGRIEFARLIEGHVLIWENGRITYRLETEQSLEQAIKIAESLEPIR